MHALATGQSPHTEAGYAARHSRLAVPDLGPLRDQQTEDDTDVGNPLATAYPTLFPYGVGLLEASRTRPISFKRHVRWCLQYHDRRFRLHHSFPFAVFGMQQKREALSSARLQMNHSGFAKVAEVFSTLHHRDLEKAAQEEAKGERFSDSRIRLLRQNLTATATRITGSDQARASYRSMILSTTYALNPPSIWLTINPNDLQDPIAQVFAGEDIDMDAFNNLAGPDADQRARNIAADPYAAAKFFKFLIDLLIREVFGVNATPNRVHSREGIFGFVSAYFGVVEAQGRGTLHLHILIWLRGAPGPIQLRELLRSQAFRDRIVDFLSRNVRAHKPQLTEEYIQRTAAVPNVAYSRPPAPTSANFAAEQDDLEVLLARTTQLHTCSPHTCLRLDRFGERRCKRKAPFPLANENRVDESGSWAIHRTYGYLNNWCPPLFPLLRSNHDIKFITNGPETKSIMWYISSYQTKKQGKTFNSSALLAKAVKNHNTSDSYLHDLQQRNRLMLFRCWNILNRENELSAPQVMMYLMDWGDNFTSHNYVPLYWTGVRGFLLRTYPELRQR